MDFSLSKEEERVAGISSCFGDKYWLKRDRDVGFPQEFVTALAQNGWLGICLPEEYGAGLGISVLD
jgi:acyl-CoA dehydrogenase